MAVGSELCCLPSSPVIETEGMLRTVLVGVSAVGVDLGKVDWGGIDCGPRGVWASDAETGSAARRRASAAADRRGEGCMGTNLVPVFRQNRGKIDAWTNDFGPMT